MVDIIKHIAARLLPGYSSNTLTKERMTLVTPLLLVMAPIVKNTTSSSVKPKASRLCAANHAAKPASNVRHYQCPRQHATFGQLATTTISHQKVNRTSSR